MACQGDLHPFNEGFCQQRRNLLTTGRRGRAHSTIPDNRDKPYRTANAPTLRTTQAAKRARLGATPGPPTKKNTIQVVILRALDGPKRQSPTASVQQTQSTLASHSAIPRGTNTTPTNSNRAIRIALQRTQGLGGPNSVFLGAIFPSELRVLLPLIVLPLKTPAKDSSLRFSHCVRKLQRNRDIWCTQPWSSCPLWGGIFFCFRVETGTLK